MNENKQDTNLQLEYEVPGDDFTRAGEASSDIKKKLRQVGVPSAIIRKVAIATYEGEINMVIHANGGKINVIIEPEKISVTLKDTGKGIPDINLAMQEGFTTAPDKVRALGFGAGMGLPNMKKYSDTFDLSSIIGLGTTVRMSFNM